MLRFLLIHYWIDRRLSICVIVICFICVIVISVICVIASSKAPSKVLFLSLYCIRLSVNSLLFVCFICHNLVCVRVCSPVRPYGHLRLWLIIYFAYCQFG